MMEIKWTSNQSFDKEKRDATMQAMLERKWTVHCHVSLQEEGFRMTGEERKMHASAFVIFFLLDEV